MAAEFEAACPQARTMAVNSRLFTARAVGWAASRGIAQFIDLGAGIPHGAGVHDMARSVLPGARAVYVDSDPEVTDHLRDVTLGGREQEGVRVIGADLSRPADVLFDPALLEIINPAEPVAVIATLVLHFLPLPLARAVIRGYTQLLAPGSVIAVSVPRIDDGAAWELVRKAYPVRVMNFTREQVRGLLAGLELVPPGAGPAKWLRPGWGDICEKDPRTGVRPRRDRAGAVSPPGSA